MMRTAQCERLTVKQVQSDLTNLAEWQQFAHSPLTWYSLLCPLSGLTVEEWRGLGEEGRWVALRDGLESLLADGVTVERDLWRAAACGYVWVRYFWAASAGEAAALMAREETIGEALLALMKGGKNRLPSWCAGYTACSRTLPTASTIVGKNAR